MLYSEVYGKLIYLTKRNNITHVEIADCVKIEHGAMFARAKRNSKINSEELKQIEKHFNVSISSVLLVDNSQTRQFNDTLNARLKDCGERISDIQEKNNLSDFQMAGLLGISEGEYSHIVIGKQQPDLRVLNNLKQNFKVSIDYILYGE